MQVQAFEGVVENGQIRLKTNVKLPEEMKVYVIIPDFEAQKVVHVYSPRLAHPEEAIDLKKEVIEELSNAGV
ncbi:MAG: hypothetical protein H6661_03360 [Ardenticatenaceae bacterium]|nr:hypothetical protein [Ardenticatenaceae bacterium]